MAITFESVKDPYGLGAAGNAIGGAYLQRSLMDLQDSKKREAEERLKKQQVGNSQILGQTLQEFMPTEEGQNWDQERIVGFISNALQNGAPVNEVLNAVKGIQPNKSSANPAQTPFTKELAKKNAALLTSYTDQGRKAKEMLNAMEGVDKAILDPERSDNFAARTFKSLPGSEITYGGSDQAMVNFSKEFVTNFSSMSNLRLTDAKLKWLQGVPPAPWKTKEANLVSAANSKRLLQIQQAYGDISRNLADGYLQAGLDVPANFEKLVEDAVEPLREDIDKMYKMSTENGQSQSNSVEVGATFNKMPNAKEYEGAEITDSKGNKFKSNGVKWSKVK